MPDTLTCMVRAIKIVAIIGAILTITGIILLVVGGFNFVPALMKLGAMQAAAAAAQNSTGDMSSTLSVDSVTLLASTPNATAEAEAEMDPMVLGLLGAVTGGLVKMYIGGGLLGVGLSMLTGCLIVFCCCVRPQLLAAAAGEGARSMQYNVVTLPGGHHLDSKMSSM
ncbi:uncharacterized protein LOC134851702 [Symsagittifera roscoffensis]|uniref:uncharacterized protein LOC134851702 n=1 Tax=Symsagittifera roscoffensis TaxID=84072 RepID=UPI00307B451C